MTDAPAVDSSYIVQNTFVSEGVSVPVADIMAVEVGKTWVPNVFWAACVFLAIAALADWLKKTLCTRLTLRTHHQTVQVRVSEQNAWKTYGAIDRALKARSAS